MVLAHPEEEWGWFRGGTLSPSTDRVGGGGPVPTGEAPTRVALERSIADGPRASRGPASTDREGPTATPCSTFPVNNLGGEHPVHPGRRQLHGGETMPRAATIEPTHLGRHRRRGVDVTEGADVVLLLLCKVCPKWATRPPRRRHRGWATGEGASDCRA